MDKDKNWEMTLRAMAKRQGLELQKSRRRDPNALGFGTYKIVSQGTGETVYGHDQWFGLDLSEAEAWLTTRKEDR